MADGGAIDVEAEDGESLGVAPMEFEQPMEGGEAEQIDPAVRDAAERRMRIARLRSQVGDGQLVLPEELSGVLRDKEVLPSSGYHGVVKKSPQCYQAKTYFKGKHVCIGSFTTAESAARAYDACMDNLVGRDCARLVNFESDEVARVAAEIAEAAVDGPPNMKTCQSCGASMGSKIRVCRQCRILNGRPTLYKGVKQKNGSSKWQAFVWHEKKNEYVGTFHTAEEAALAYDMRSREVFGDKAPVNWPTREEGEAAVEAVLQACTGDRNPIHKKRKRGQPALSGEPLMDASVVQAIDAEGTEGTSGKKKRRKKVPKAEGASGAMPTDGSIGADTESGFQLGAFAFGVPPLAPLGVMAAKLVAGLGQAPQPEGVEAGGEAGAEVQPEDPFPPAGADAAKPPAKKRGRKKAAEAGVAAAGADGTDAAPPKQRKPRKPKAAVPDAAAATGAAQEANGLSAPHFAPLGWVPPLPATSGANDAAAIAPILRESEGLVSLFETGASAQPGDDGAKAGAGLPPPGGTAIGLMSGADTGDRAQAKAATAAPPAADASLLEPLVSLGSLLRPLGKPATPEASAAAGGAAVASDGAGSSRSGHTPVPQQAPQQAAPAALPPARKVPSVLESLLSF